MKKAVFFFLSFFFLSALPAFAACTATLNPPHIPANTSTTVNVTYSNLSFPLGSLGENASINSVVGIGNPSWTSGCTVYNGDHYGCGVTSDHQNDTSFTVPVTFNIPSDQIGHFEVDPAAGGSSNFCNAILYVDSDYPTQTPTCTVSLNPPHIPAGTTTTVNVTYTDSSYAVGSVGENAPINSIGDITTPSWSTGCTNYNGDHYGCQVNSAHQNDASWTVPVNFNISSDQMGRYEVDPAGGGTSHFCYANLYIDSDYTNQPPSINALPNVTINEGDTYSANGSFTDSDSTSWTATVDYGDGSGSHALTLSGTNFSLSHVYKDNGTYTVTVSVTDNQGATSDPATAQVTVNNIAPTPGAITVSTNPVQVNTATSATASFTDPGVLDTHTASWNWGDGNTTSGTVTESNGSGTVGADSHTYTSAGVYEITLTITDKDGGVGTQPFKYVSVYNPTAQGLFSAGQKYTSPAGAYAANTSLTGTVLFGLSYKYQGTMPTGVRQFSMDFNQANFHFNATSVNSLVISSGIGTLTGTGTVTGSTGTYNFLVTGSESANTIRIQVKDSSGNVLYDTQPGAADNATPTTSVTGNVLAH